MIKLGVNVDHVATLRQARGTVYPSPLEAAHACIRAGADGITIHLREDRRHIQDADLIQMLDAGFPVPLNLEMANSAEIVDMAVVRKPQEVCLVPERREEVTTEGGLDAAGQLEALRPSIIRLLAAGIRVSLFVEPSRAQLDAAAALCVPVVELHTGRYSDLSDSAQRDELERLADAAVYGHSLGLQINAGHGLNVENLPLFLDRVPHLDTLNIGHSIISRAVLVGLPAAVREVKALLPS